MALDYGFAGEVNRNNAMNAVGDTMNAKNMEILAVSLEMGGKKSVQLDGKFYAMDRMNATKMSNMGLQFDPTTGAITTGHDGVKNDVMSLLGIDAKTVTGGAAGLTVTLDATNPNNVKLSVHYTDSNTKRDMAIGVGLDSNGVVKEFAPLAETALNAPLAFRAVDDKGGLLQSWGITNAEDLQPGDLFLIQQKLQIIKDLISAVNTVGKTQGDVMREVSQKFSQG